MIMNVSIRSLVLAPSKAVAKPELVKDFLAFSVGGVVVETEGLLLLLFFNHFFMTYRFSFLPGIALFPFIFLANKLSTDPIFFCN